MDRLRVGRGEAAFMIGVPLAWAVLLLFHPGGEADEVYVSLQDEVTEGFVVHIGMLIFIPLMAAVIYLLLRGVEGTAAQVSRWALVPFVVFYSAWEVLQGIANSILVDEVKELPETERSTGINLVQDFAESPLARDLGVFATIGTLGFIVAVIAAGIALRRNAGAPVSVLVLLVLSGFLITAHPPPFGPTGLVLFVLALLLFWRSQSAAVREPATA
jgi:hypothetical protein